MLLAITSSTAKTPKWLTILFLVVCNILVETRIEDIGDVDGPDVVEEHVEPHGDDGNREPVADKENSVVLERIANRNGSNDETRVREHHSPPSQMEVNGPLVNDLCHRSVTIDCRI